VPVSCSYPFVNFTETTLEPLITGVISEFVSPDDERLGGTRVSFFFIDPPSTGIDRLHCSVVVSMSAIACCFAEVMG
jgi:hypothetical protein